MTHDDYVERATTFDGDDAPSEARLDGSESLQQHYQRLSLLNSLSWDGKWRDEQRETARNSSAIVDAIASQMALTDYQKDEAHYAFSSLPDRFNESRSTALLALCICAIVANRDGRDYHPNQTHPNSDISNRFAEIANELDFSYSNLISCWRAIEDEVDE